MELTKDLTSETFLKVYLHIKGFQWRNVSFSAWVYRIATNEMNMADRRKKSRSASLDQLMETGFFELVDPQSLESEKKVMERQLEQSKDFVLMQQKLKLLPSKYQEVLSLRFFESKPIKEIAEILNKKEGTVKSLLSRGLEKLRLSL
jgi:RNA polymerase sigma-70 factor (ECF subfamily)